MNDNKVDTLFLDNIADKTKAIYGKPDMVHKPPHYKLPGLPVEVIDVRSALLKTIPPNTPYEAVTSWNESWTYITRMWGKNGLEDAEKGLFYLQRMITIMKGEL